MNPDMRVAHNVVCVVRYHGQEEKKKKNLPGLGRWTLSAQRFPPIHGAEKHIAVYVLV